MVRNQDLIAIFHSIHRVMKAEKALKQSGIEVLLIPVPRQLSSDCGLALRFAPVDLPLVAAALRPQGLKPAEVYRYIDENFEPLDPHQLFP